MPRGTILHIEDQIAMRDLARAVCLSEGYHYIGTATSARAREVLSEEAVEFILSDISMPEGDDAGLSLLREVRGMPRFRGVPVIMLTNSRDERRVRGALEIGADDYLVKPFKPNRLLLALERWSRVADADIDWSSLSESRAKLVRATLGSLGHAFDVVAHGGEPPVALLKHNCADLLQAASDDRVVGLLGTLRQSYASSFAHSLKMSGFLAFYAHSQGAGWDRMQDMVMAGLLHDIGVSRMEPAQLQKPRRTASDVRRYDAEHLRHNKEIVAQMADSLSPEATSLFQAVCCHHHERLDGSGPLGLTEAALSTEARLAAIIDTYLDLRTGPDSRNTPLSKAECIEKLKMTPGLDGQLIETFIAMFE